MAEDCPGKIIYFGRDCSGPVMSAHLASGERAAYLQGESLILAEGASETHLMKVGDIPATYGGTVPFQAMNALAAAAACWGAGVPVESIRLGLRTFQTDEKMTPGRFNVFNVDGARVIVDYGHNPHALRAIQESVRQMHPQRTIGVVAAPGDRRDVDIQELATVAAHTFDTRVVREDDDLRGRERGEVANLIAAAVARANPSLPLSIVFDEGEAVAEALKMMRQGDLLVIFVDRVDETVEQVRAASRAIAMEKSDALWCPLPDSPPAIQLERAEVAALVSQIGPSPAAGNGGTQPASGGNASHTSYQRNANNAPSGAPYLPEMQDGEVGGTT
jgi:cyanophycin synthetase